jgi:hypothetical protein
MKLYAQLLPDGYKIKAQGDVQDLKTKERRTEQHTE